MLSGPIIIAVTSDFNVKQQLKSKFLHKHLRILHVIFSETKTYMQNSPTGEITKKNPTPLNPDAVRVK